MIVFLASDDAKTMKLFNSFETGKKNSVRVFRRSELLKELKKTEEGPDFIWYDIAGLDAPSLKSTLKTLAKLDVSWALVDRKGLLEDASEAFWSGAADYIGPKTDPSGITVQRIKKALVWKSASGNNAGFHGAQEAAVPGAKKSGGKNKGATNGGDSKSIKSGKGGRDDPAPLKTSFIDSSAGWAAIKEGCEYTFAFAYVQIDKADRLFSTIGETRTAALDKEFRAMIELSFADCGGQVWMWRDYGGLLLFPFNGKSCPVILDALKLWLDRPIRYAGNPALSVGFTFRMAIHIGNTTYRRPGKTGDLTSDTLNSIFHIGYKFMKADTFYVTEEAAPYIPPVLTDLFVDAGIYEARSIKRMLALL